MLGFAGFCGRHFFALLVIVVLACVAWTVAYFALLFWATVSGGGIGGPLAYPAGLLFAAVATVAAGIAFFLPSTRFAEWFARRRGLPILAQIPISLVCLGVLCLILVGVVQANRQEPFAIKTFLGWTAFLIGIQLLPLGIYWWIAQAGPLAMSVLRRFRRK